MTLMDIGTKLVTLVKAGKNSEAMETLYDPAIVSVEAGAPPGMNRESTGLAACLEKGKAFRERHEVHGSSVMGPFPHGDRFAIFLSYELTARATNQNITMNEIAVYTVANEKIVREEFFYAM
jgi:hypothetical protein